MKYANSVSDMLNAFSQDPLTIEQLDEFYCDDTMEYRMSDKYSSPIEDIFDDCQQAGGHNAFLLLGHRGCGKSTELTKMSRNLISNGYPVKTIICSLDLDLLNIAYSDLLILMGEALLEIAEESGCKIDAGILGDMAHFWSEGTEITISQVTGEASVEAGMSAETPRLFANILNFFTRVKAELKLNEETRKEYRNKISNHSSEWIGMMNRISEEIAREKEGKLPTIIFEDLDKLNPDDAWKVFYNYAKLLSDMSFPVIYTFPIALSYDGKFSAMEGYFITRTLPMIKIETIEGTPYEDGINIIRGIVEKRARLDLFEGNVLDRLIQYTGGSLRDLFYAINSSAKRAERRSAAAISIEDSERALEEIKTSLTRRIDQKDYEFLLNIYNGNKEQIEDREKLLKMLQASVVLEYNGRRWHNVHPLVVRFFIEQGKIKDVEE